MIVILKLMTTKHEFINKIKSLYFDFNNTISQKIRIN